MKLLVAAVFSLIPSALGAGAGTSADPCTADCVGTECTFDVSLSPLGNSVAQYVIAQCPAGMQAPVLGMKYGVK